MTTDPLKEFHDTLAQGLAGDGFYTMASLDKNNATLLELTAPVSLVDHDCLCSQCGQSLPGKTPRSPTQRAVKAIMNEFYQSVDHSNRATRVFIEPKLSMEQSVSGTVLIYSAKIWRI